MRTGPSDFAANRLHGSRGGFTLVELISVIAIILVVVGLLSAALNQTKSRTLRVTCLDNMKQLQLAWMLYADENNDYLALNKSEPNSLGLAATGLQPHSTNSWVAGNPRVDRTPQNITAGTLYPYLRHTDVYRCPMDSSLTKTGNFRTRSYSMDAYLGGDNEDIDPRVKMKGSELIAPPPEKVFVFIEEHEDSVWGGGFLVLPRERFTLNSGSWSSTPSDRHLQGCNLTFADGHLEYWKWLAPKKANLNNQLISNPKELRDLHRLQDCVPR
jgi:prepilin-type N-terminal cleavage/methylation domain-containing protein/prepilin-type processing-associated H-X9-DG protein